MVIGFIMQPLVVFSPPLYYGAVLQQDMQVRIIGDP